MSKIVPLMNEYIPLTQEEIEKDYEEIKQYHEKYLKQYKIPLSRKNTNKTYQLIYLYHFMGTAIHKDVITKFVQDHNDKASGDQQTRHLSYAGYYVVHDNQIFEDKKVPAQYYCLFTLECPNPSWLQKQEARSVIVSTDEFEILKKQYDYCCATCGAREGTIHRYSKQIVKLQKGHCDPNLPLVPGNIIPQCQYCNRDLFKDNFVFTLEGRPDSINNPEFILRSSDSVQREMLRLLKEKYE